MLSKVLLVFGCLLCGIGFAAEVGNLFQAEVTAESMAADDRDAAIKEALSIVLQRVLTGDNVANDLTVRSVLAQAPQYVDQYQFALTENSQSSGASERLLRVAFDEERLLNLFKTGTLGIWNEIRPETLVWLVLDDRGKRRFFKPDTMPDIDTALDKASVRKGLPLIFPMLDLEEREHITVNDVLSAYPEQLLDVSARYDVVSILVGRLVKKEACWQAEWAHYFDGKVVQWTGPCVSLFDALLGGMAGTYDTLSKFYGVKPKVPESGVVTLNIAGITDIDDMSRVSDYLTALPMVESVAWTSVEAGFNRYRIHYKSDRRQFEHRIRKDNVLEPMSKSGPEGLSYRLLPKH
ncbi:MAG: DUF2066 domain-containing protein [Gammaproteobacteria bacterium]